MIGGLEQPNSGESTFARAFDDGFHEDASNAPVLNVGRDGDRADPGDSGALIEAVAANQAPIRFRDDAVKARMGKEHPEKADSGFGRGKFEAESVFGADTREGVEANRSTDGSVFRCGAANLNGRMWRWSGHGAAVDRR